MGGEQSCAMGLLSWAPETTASSGAPTATPALGADEVLTAWVQAGPGPWHTGEPFWIWHHPGSSGHRHHRLLRMCCSIRWEDAFN